MILKSIFVAADMCIGGTVFCSQKITINHRTLYNGKNATTYSFTEQGSMDWTHTYIIEKVEGEKGVSGRCMMKCNLTGNEAPAIFSSEGVKEVYKRCLTKIAEEYRDLKKEEKE